MEALAAGVPVVARDLPVLREVFGDTVAFAGDVDGIADALGSALHDPVDPLAGRALAASYSWSAAAAAHVELYGRPRPVRRRTRRTGPVRRGPRLMRVSISRAFTELADEDPDRLAVDDGTTRLDRRALEERSNRLAWLLLEAGVTPDAFVTVIGSNRVDTVVATVAAWKAGATPQPLSPRLPPSDRDAVLDLVRPALVLTDQPTARHRSMPSPAAVSGTVTPPCSPTPRRAPGRLRPRAGAPAPRRSSSRRPRPMSTGTDASLRSSRGMRRSSSPVRCTTRRPSSTRCAA